MTRKVLGVLLISAIALSAVLVAGTLYLRSRTSLITQTDSGLETDTYVVQKVPAQEFLEKAGYSRIENLEIQNMPFEETGNAGYVLTSDDGSILVASKLDNSSTPSNLILKVYMDPDIATKSSEWAVNIFLLSGLLHSSPSEEKSLSAKYPDIFKNKELGELKLVTFK